MVGSSKVKTVFSLFRKVHHLAMQFLFASLLLMPPLAYSAGSFYVVVGLSDNTHTQYGIGSIKQASDQGYFRNLSTFQGTNEYSYSYAGPTVCNGDYNAPPLDSWTEYCTGFFVVTAGGATGPYGAYPIGYLNDRPPPKNLGPECSPGTPSTSNPIRIGTGNKFMLESDTSATGGDLTFKRYYNGSELAPSGRIGQGWRHGYERAIEPVAKSNGTSHVNFASIIRETGNTFTFELTNGIWTGDADLPEHLATSTDASGQITSWQLITRQNETEHYDAQGRLQSISAIGGKITTLAYDATGKLQTVTDTFGRQLTLAYDAQNRLITLTDPAGGLYTYTYDTTNNLTSVTYPDHTQKQYHYDNPTYPHALTGITDENGNRYATYAYDANGRAISTEHAGGADKYTLSYQTDGSTLVTDPLGTVRNYAFQTILGVNKNTAISQACASCGGANAAITYDANGNIASKTDFNGNTTTYTYDLTRNLETSRTEASGTPQARTITTVWHPSYRLPSQISEPGRSTTYTYDERGNLTRKTQSAGSQTRAWNYTYNQWGQVLSADGPRTDVADLTTYAYDAQGNLTTLTNALGQVTRILSHDPHGRPLTIVDPNLIATQFSYDARGRLTRRAVEQDVTTYAYDGVGQLTQLTQPDGSRLSYSYDPAHRLVGIADGQGNRIAYTLDNAGNRTGETVTDPSGALARTRSQAFDALGRLAQILDSQNHATTYGYDANGNPTSSTDANGATTTHSYDPLNRLIQTLTPDGGQTHHQYDSLDHLASVTDPIGVTTSYATDGLDNLSTETSPDSGTTKNTYDAAGNLLTSTSPTGIKLSYRYDALNRLTEIKRGSTVQIAYAWDTPPGKLSGYTDLSGNTQYSYDTLGRLSAKTQTQGTLVQSVA
jgi:YD repeat-containing protein